MKYVIFVFTFSLIFAPLLNINHELITQSEIDNIFSNLTPDLIGGKEDDSNLSRNNLSNFNH